MAQNLFHVNETKLEIFADLEQWFQRINAYIKTDYSKDHAAVGFAYGTGQIARIHQFGLTRRPSAKSKPVAYPKRELAGFSEDDVSWIQKTILDFMSKK